MQALLDTAPPPSPAPDTQGNLTAIAPDAARAHLDKLWDRLLDVDSLHRQATSSGA